MVCYDDGGIQRNCFVGNGFGKVDCEKDGVRLAARRDEGCFE